MPTFLEQFAALDVAGQAALTRQYLAQKPVDLFADLRANHPILQTPIGVLVSRADDVRTVLRMNQELTVSLYARKMERITGPFILGMPDNERYRREAAVLRLAFPDPDRNALEKWFTETVDAKLSTIKGTCQIDIVQELTRWLPTQFVKVFFGVQGPDDPTLQRWARTIFHDIFLNLANDPAIQSQADASALEMNRYIDELIALNSVKSVTEHTVIERLIRLQSAVDSVLTADVIRHNLVGITVGAIDTTSKAAAYVVDWLLSHPDSMQVTAEAIANGNDSQFYACILESMRFAPQSTALVRLCEIPVTLGQGRQWECQVAVGKLVFAGTASAMMDAEYLSNPEEFRPGRDSSAYLHYGEGQHACFGRYVNTLHVAAIVRGVFKLTNVRRVEGPDGFLKHEGPFPSKLVLQFD